ncbi:DUF418 domain-containing protein [Mucilaginibacter gynuensis]|uniref:DUF418 domain-containing protein n=1 Tax=Mucilaginibacter gynuensis TaxID=1302236 RepID=UPI003CD097FE
MASNTYWYYHIYGIGMGLMGQFGPFALKMFAVLIFLLRIIVSTLWLKYSGLASLNGHGVVLLTGKGKK